MKTKFLNIFLMCLFLTAGQQAKAASVVTVNIDGESYTCTKGGGTAQDCFVLFWNEKDPHGNECYGHRACGHYYAFGKFVDSSWADSQDGNNAKDMAEWCKRKMAPGN